MPKKGAPKTSCNTCECVGFRFIPRRPEEVGMGHLPRRKGFNINTWGASCICGHTHKEHKAKRPHSCKTCNCYDFQSDFACVGCDKKFEEHETIYETERERKAEGKAVGLGFRPLATNPEAQEAAMRDLGIDGRTPEQKFLDEIRQEEERKLTGGMLNLELSAGGEGRPQVNLMINTNKNLRPKQDLNKPERSIRLMQEYGMAGQSAPKTAVKAGSKIPSIKPKVGGAAQA